MNFTMNIPGLKEVIINEMTEQKNRIVLHVSMPQKEHTCPDCGQLTDKVHDYRIQKIKHLKWFERLTVLFYKRRRYRCSCGKRFSEDSPFVERYQRFSKEWNQVVRIRSVKAKTFKEAADVLGTSSSTVIRRFKQLVHQLPEKVRLPKAIAIDEFKADTDAGTYQLIIANADTHEPIDILPNRRKETIKHYLQENGADVEIVVMDMNPSFKAAVKKALNRPVIVADRFHYCRYIHWAVDEVRRKVQNEWNSYDRKKAKRMRYVLHKDEHKLTEKERWYLNRYINMSTELKEAHELKELYKKWQRESKKESVSEVKVKLYDFYRKVEETKNPAFLKAIKTFKNWQKEILNSYAFGYSNGFLEGIKNTSKVLKRNAYGFRKFEHYKAKILLNHVYKNVGIHLG
ncbi:ISL3 family transposase [Solibacillus sp. FSL R7-0682]|uniref:ISL3 family transposase n=2 Tax=unclassified Solibacillus TaxID=2637870 RepID=UPI0030FB1069